MSGQNFNNLPYQARQPRSARPSKPLPPPPPPEVEASASNDFDPTEAQLLADLEVAQGFTSPPSPPPPPPTRRPPPPPIRPPPPMDSQSGSGDGGEGGGTGTAKSTADHLHPYVSALPDHAQIPLTLTPLRAHYLKKTLVALQLSHELALITDPVLGANALGLLGEPFTMPPELKKEALQRVSDLSRQEGISGDLPFMRFLFHQFLLPFPFLSTAPPSFWSAKVQPFLSSFLTTTGVVQRSSLTREEKVMAESLMSKEEKKEVVERAKLWNKVEKHSALMIGVGIKVVGGEEVVRIGQSELRRIEGEREARRQEWLAKRGLLRGPTGPPGSGLPPPPSSGMVFEVNVVGVRAIAEKSRVRSKSHEEFLIRTKRTGVPDVYVSRRYGDFKRLSDEIRSAFPDYILPTPPAKDKSVTTATPVQAQQYSYYNPLRMVYGNSPQPSGRASPAAGDSPNSPSFPPTSAPVPLSREKNRLTLRAYLQSIIAFPEVINSPVLRSFLLSGPIQLTPAEQADVKRRLDGDAVREEGRKRFREEAEKRIDGLREGLAQFKGDVLSSDGGLKRVFEVVRRVERVQDLPKAEASVIEWGRISLAATIFQVFVASDTSSEQLASMKRLHGMVPYFVLKGILRISNPMAMIRGVLDLFLARPFGGQSLIQRMFSSSLTEDVRMLAEDISMVAEKIEDPVICQKIEQYCMAPFEIQEIYRKDAAAEGVDLLVVILRSSDMPTLSRPQLQRCYKASRAYKAYKSAQAEMDDSDDDMGPEDDDAWLFEDLNLLLKLWTKRREKEGLLALIFEGVTAELLKDIITIFYAPLAQVYKAASIADSLGDLQNFMNDMIRTIEQVDEASQEDPARTVQTFIDLVQRHEQSFYTFVHNVHSKGSGLFDALMAWIELFLSFARDGLPQPVDLDFLLPDAGPQRQAIMAEVDAVAQYHYRMKLAHEEKIRRRFEKDPTGATDTFTGMEEADEAELMGTVMANLNLDDAAIDMVEDEESSDEDSDDEDEDEDDRHSDRSSIASGLATGTGHKSSPLLAPVPDHFGPNAPNKRDRRGSNHSGTGRSGFHKLRHSVDFTKSPLEQEISTSSSSGKSPKMHNTTNTSNPPETPRRSPRPKMSKKKRRRMQIEAEIAPETKAIEEMRPLFMEILKPLLKVKPLVI